MTPQQQEAHKRMLATYPVRTKMEDKPKGPPPWNKGKKVGPYKQRIVIPVLMRKRKR